MGTFSGQRIRDVWGSVLHVDTGNAAIDGSLVRVEDGRGTDTALQLSTTGAQIDGNLTVTGTLSAPAVENLLGNSSAITATGSTTARSLAARFAEFVNVLDYGADPTGVADSSAAFTAAWAKLKATLVTVTNANYVTVAILVPPGVYKIGTSVNWTALIAWNIHIQGRGAVLLGSCTGKAVIDACNVRGLHIDGLEVQGSATQTPSCGILVGPAGTNTCGNNNFRDVKLIGTYSKAPFCNLGSETTYYHNCYFANSSADAAAYAYIADGRHLFGLTSDYVTLRASGTAVSFTNNVFYSCHLRNYGTGSGTYLDYTNGWMFDRGCYHLAFDNSNVVVRQTVTYRNISLHLAGLFETSQLAGVKTCVRIVLTEGDVSTISGFTLDAASPHASEAIIKLVNDSGTAVSSGAMRLDFAKITVAGTGIVTGPPLFAGANLSIQGEISCRDGSQINLGTLASFQGTIYTDDFTLMTLPSSGGFAYTVYDRNSLSGQVQRFGGPGAGQVGVQGGTVPALRAEGTATDIDLRLQGKGTGVVRTTGALTVGSNLTVTGTITGSTTATGSTTSRTLAARAADIYNVKDFGAVGDNVVDDTAALQAAINAARSNANSGRGTARLFLPPGVYRHTGLTIARPLELFGSGPQTSYLLQVPGTAAPSITVSVDHGGFDYYNNGLPRAVVTISDLRIWGGGKADTANAGTSHGIKLTPASSNGTNCWVKLENLTIYNTAGDAIHATSGWSGMVHGTKLYVSNVGRDGIAATGCFDWRFSHCELETCGQHGINLSECEMFVFDGVYSYAAAQHGLSLSGSVGVNTFIGCMFDRNSRHGVYYNTSDDARFIACTLGFNSRAAADTYSDIYINSTGAPRLEHCRFGHTFTSSPATRFSKKSIEFAGGATGHVDLRACEFDAGLVTSTTVTNQPGQLRTGVDGSLVVGTAALATTATDGFIYAPSCAGTPTGTPSTHTGTVPIVIDTSASKLWARIGGAWKSVTLA